MSAAIVAHLFDETNKDIYTVKARQHDCRLRSIRRAWFLCLGTSIRIENPCVTHHGCTAFLSLECPRCSSGYIKVNVRFFISEKCRENLYFI
jgi:hypothetical protein